MALPTSQKITYGPSDQQKRVEAIRGALDHHKGTGADIQAVLNTAKTIEQYIEGENNG